MNKHSHPEYQYLNTLEDLVRRGKQHGNRTGVDTLRTLGVMHKYDFQDGFPLFTTKKTWFKGVVIELLWFLSGDSNIKFLVDNNVGIWTDDAYRVYKNTGGDLSKEDFVDHIKNGKPDPRGDKGTYKLGELGPVYGVQWRGWNGYYDQIEALVSGLKNNPSSRRHILTAWNPAQIEQMALPSCHVMSQWTVDEGKLWCTMYQRSCDMFLGVPFNVASYSLLTYMLAQVTSLQPGGLVHMMNDSHLYLTHIPMTEELLKRVPREFPKLELNPNIKNIDDFKFEDFKLINYKPYPAIKAPLHTG